MAQKDRSQWNTYSTATNRIKRKTKNQDEKKER